MYSIYLRLAAAPRRAAGPGRGAHRRRHRHPALWRVRQSECSLPRARLRRRLPLLEGEAPALLRRKLLELVLLLHERSRRTSAGSGRAAPRRTGPHDHGDANAFVEARHSHGGIGCGSAHKPRRAARASSSRVRSVMSFVYLRNHHAQPRRTSSRFTLRPSSSVTSASRRRRRSAPWSRTVTTWPAIRSLSAWVAWLLKRCLSFAKTPSGGQVVDLSTVIRTICELDDHSPAPPASSLSLPLRRPSSACPGERSVAPPARR